MLDLARSVSIVGAGSTRLGSLPDQSTMQLYAEAATKAIADAGLSPRDIDGVLTVDAMAEPYRVQSVALAEYLGLRLNYSMTVALGGASHCAMVGHAGAALEAGLCNNVLIVSADKLRTGLTKDQAVAALAEGAGHPQYERPYSPTIPSMYALAAQRHMFEYGTTREQLAQVAVEHRAHAAANPEAQERQPISIRDVLDAKPIAEPLGMLDCSLVSDGGGALVVTRSDRVNDKARAVDLLGYAEHHEHEYIHQATSLTTTGAAISAARAFEMARLEPRDVDLAMVYDCFTITVIILLEDLGFCAKGDGGPFAASGAIGLRGSLPVNTHGGLLSHGHPGRPGGIFHLIEAVRQLRGECGPRQVASASTALVHGNGGVLSTHATAILGRRS